MILDLLKNDGLEPRHKGRGEHCSPCPDCGGDDRFIIDTEKGRYWCRQCGMSGDAIQYLRDFHGMSFQEAAEAVEKGSFVSSKKAPIIRLQKRKIEPTINRAAWKKEAAKAISSARQELSKRPAVMQWLKAERGITPETSQRFKLGWLPENIYPERNAWGLPEEFKEDGTPKKLFIPAGLVIPGPNRIRIRRESPGDFGKYHVVQGSSTAPLEVGTPYETTAIIVESELDAILLAQEIRRKVYIVAVGSTNISEEHRLKLIEKLQNCPVVLVSFDSDNPGAKAAAGWTEANIDTLEVFRAPVPTTYGKDITDAFLTGLDLNDWLSACMELFAESALHISKDLK